MPGPATIGPVNYATEYSRFLDQEYPYVLNFGALYATPNNALFRWVDAKTIAISTITTTGRVNADRDTIAFASRNYSNAWTNYELTNQRKWSTLVHPKDIDQSNMVNSIANITRVFNEFQKFPEMDSYLVSKVYKDYTAAGNTADTTVLTTANILSVFDTFMANMDKKRVPKTGRILYLTPDVEVLLKNAANVARYIDIKDENAAVLNRMVARLDQVEIVSVPDDLMMTLYDFTEGAVTDTANDSEQINMFLIHPTAVMTPVSYNFVNLNAPSALSEGKYVYFEESFEDVFVLENKMAAIQFNITPA